MYKISVIPYLNSQPFINGILSSPYLKQNSTLEFDYPSKCAEKIINKQSDIGLLPVGVLPLLDHYKIISEYCIGAKGDVQSVMLFSDVPLENIKTILLDYQSRTSVLLVKVLCKELWGITPDFQSSTTGFENKIKETKAGVVIGDRALLIKKKYSYVYDLAGEWKKLTGLPFVFAVWVAIKSIDVKFSNELGRVFKENIADLNLLCKELEPKYPGIDTFFYLNHCINYNFDQLSQQGLSLFLNKIKLLY